ncbi:hypothetical protein EC9_48830 [Rosistilla ulvae]|uniref:Uncharacterized protein n=1 Tax=Rosistilla ulvae TaxID=1930277 RepID=A0A517M706_9BACT|nr:hypothetical protein EC9_48830 [Rosistilla ulvae]
MMVQNGVRACFQVVSALPDGHGWWVSIYSPMVPVPELLCSFWPSPAKDDIMRRASADAGATFIDISALGSDKSNQASAEREF